MSEEKPSLLWELFLMVRELMNEAPTEAKTRRQQEWAVRFHAEQGVQGSSEPHAAASAVEDDDEDDEEEDPHEHGSPVRSRSAPKRKR